MDNKVLLIIAIVGFHATAAQLYEGSECTLQSGSPGICRQLEDCAYQFQQTILQLRTNEERCSFDGDTEIVCCPEDVEDISAVPPNPNRPAEFACQLYDQMKRSFLRSGPPKPVEFVTNGELAYEGELPFMVALGYPDSENPSSLKYVCGGGLITPKHVLTAAHCVDNFNGDVPVQARLGSVHKKIRGEDHQEIPIKVIIVEPRYKRSLNYHDIAIVVLTREARLSENVLPACLQTRPLKPVIPMESAIIVAGWGITDINSDHSQDLLKTTNLGVVPMEKCSMDYGNHRKLPRGLDESMICLRDMNPNTIQSGLYSDACQGDSGGPVIYGSLSWRMDRIVGVTSFGQACGSKIPGVYTKVYNYIDWIESVMAMA